MTIFSQTPHGLTELQGTSTGARRGWAKRRSFGSLKKGLRANPALHTQFKLEQNVKRLARQEAVGYLGAAQIAEGRGMHSLAKKLKTKVKRGTRQATQARRSAQSVVRKLTSGKY